MKRYTIYWQKASDNAAYEWVKVQTKRIIVEGLAAAQDFAYNFEAEKGVKIVAIEYSGEER